MLEQLASEKKCTPAQLALAWCLAQGDDIVPIPGTKKLKYLHENIEAVKVQLTSTDIRNMNSMFPVGIAAGERYPAIQMQRIGK
jgi:aryl-alcohol dehydrogenase-like predicted oxidoreductase